MVIKATLGGLVVGAMLLVGAAGTVQAAEEPLCVSYVVTHDAAHPLQAVLAPCAGPIFDPFALAAARLGEPRTTAGGEGASVAITPEELAQRLAIAFPPEPEEGE